MPWSPSGSHCSNPHPRPLLLSPPRSWTSQCKHVAKLLSTSQTCYIFILKNEHSKMLKNNIKKDNYTLKRYVVRFNLYNGQIQRPWWLNAPCHLPPPGLPRHQCCQLGTKKGMGLVFTHHGPTDSQHTTAQCSGLGIWTSVLSAIIYTVKSATNSN